MSREAPSTTGRGGRAAITALLAVAVAAGMLLLVRAGPGVESFDPRSSAPDGANGAVLLLEQFGATVEITANPPSPQLAGDERVFVISDSLNPRQRSDLLTFVEHGGVAVVADPASSLHGGAGVDGGAIELEPIAPFEGVTLDARAESNVRRGECTIGALTELRGLLSPSGILFPSPPDDFCMTNDIGDSSHAFVIVRHHGDGVVVGFGDNNVVTNRYLRYADNAGLITALLAPAPGAHVRIVLGAAAKPEAADVGTGDQRLADLVRPGVWMALSQLLLAFVVFCFARGVRPGRVVAEPEQVPVAGSELVVATGNLMHRAHHAARAGWLLRSEFYRFLTSYAGAPPNVPIDELSNLVSRRSGVDVRAVKAVLLREVDSPETLLSLSRDIDALRESLSITTKELR